MDHNFYVVCVGQNFFHGSIFLRGSKFFVGVQIFVSGFLGVVGGRERGGFLKKSQLAVSLLVLREF